MNYAKLEIFQPGHKRNFNFPLNKRNPPVILLSSCKLSFPHQCTAIIIQNQVDFLFLSVPNSLGLLPRENTDTGEAKSNSVKINEDVGHNRILFIHHIPTSFSLIRDYQQFLDNSCTKLSYNQSYKTSQVQERKKSMWSFSH